MLFHVDKGRRVDVPLDCNDIIHNDSLFQGQTSMDETPVVLDTQEDGLYKTHMESAEHDHNILGEKKDLSQKVNTDPSFNFDIKSQDNYGETDSEPQGCVGSKTGLKNDSIIMSLCTEAVEIGGIDVAVVVNKTTRNLVDYSEIAVHTKSQEYAKLLPLKIDATKNQNLVRLEKNSGAQNNRKRLGSCPEEERRNKKSKKSVDPTTCRENIPLLGEHLEDASQGVVNASANKGTCKEKKKKRVLTKERKAKKKKKEKIKRAKKDRKLGVKRLKLQPVIKEKKITYCRHYLNGRCHEGEKCKFSHDTTPVTKSKPCCHFARHACMKGDDCPFDHQLSKYPCNNYQTKGSCNRGSDCMFSHKLQPNEVSINESNKSKLEQKPLSDAGSKVETKSCSVPILVDSTPKSTRTANGINFLSQEKLPLESRPPKGISFLSQEKLPLESSSSPKVDSEVKEITKIPLLIQDSEDKTKELPVVQDSEEITKTPTVVSHGINFLSFGKKPGSDHSTGGYSFRISNRVEKSPLSNVVGEGSKFGPTVNVANEVKDDLSTNRPNS